MTKSANTFQRERNTVLLEIFIQKMKHGVRSGILFVCFVALLSKSTAMDMEGRSVHFKPHFFLGKLGQAVNQ